MPYYTILQSLGWLAVRSDWARIYNVFPDERGRSSKSTHPKRCRLLVEMGTECQREQERRRGVVASERRRAPFHALVVRLGEDERRRDVKVVTFRTVGPGKDTGRDGSNRACGMPDCAVCGKFLGMWTEDMEKETPGLVEGRTL